MIKPCKRLPDWMVRLDELVRTLWNEPFSWGSRDCCTLAADVVNAVTGVDVMGDLRGSYDTEFGAMRKVTELGGMEAILNARLGLQVPVLCAQVADIGMCDDGRLVFCSGPNWTGQGEHGLVTTDNPVKVWRCHE